MAVDLWFRDDIRNLLLALNASSAGAALLAQDPAATAYRIGYQEALAAVALACGLPPGAICSNAGPTLSVGQTAPPSFEEGDRTAARRQLMG